MPLTEPDEVRRSIDEVLARPELADTRGLLDRAWDWVFDRLGDLLSSLVSPGGGAAGWAVVAVVVMMGVLLAVRLTSGMRRDPRVAAGVTDPVGRPARDWRAEAETHEAAGRWRLALRCRWRALVSDLAGRGVLDEVPGRTAGEYRRDLARAAPGAAPAFEEATSLFEAAWYGDRSAGPDDARRLRSMADAVLSGSGARP